jgi:hypothetical protein
MYDELVIEYIKKKEEQEKEFERPFLELPVPHYEDRVAEDLTPEPKRVIIIEL